MIGNRTDNPLPGTGLRVRSYGAAGPMVIVLHGGPGAAGSAEPLARALAGRFRVLEPWQRGSGNGDEPLTVARHVADLHELIVTRCQKTPPALVGESWGAMLALAYAAAHPQHAGPLVLIGCGTFDPDSRAHLQATLKQRTSAELARRLDHLPREFPDPGEQLRQRYALTRSLYLYDPITIDEEQDDAPLFDERAHTETWADMLRLQQAGIYPATFAAIRSPILMLHGAYDPHPGQMIRASLAPYLPQLEYHEWERCGHFPLLERAARNEFLDVLRTWLTGPVPRGADSV